MRVDTNLIILRGIQKLRNSGADIYSGCIVDVFGRTLLRQSPSMMRWELA